MIPEARRAKAIEDTCERLRDAANVRFVMVFAPRAELHATSGEGYLAEFLGIEELARVFSDGIVLTDLTDKKFVVRTAAGSNVYVQKLAPKAFLIIGYDDQSSLGLVRMQAEKVERDLAGLLERGAATLH